MNGGFWGASLEGKNIRSLDLNALSLRGKERVLIKQPSGDRKEAARYIYLEFVETVRSRDINLESSKLICKSTMLRIVISCSQVKYKIVITGLYINITVLPRTFCVIGKSPLPNINCSEPDSCCYCRVWNFPSGSLTRIQGSWQTVNSLLLVPLKSTEALVCWQYVLLVLPFSLPSGDL